MSRFDSYSSLTPFNLHKQLINHYVLTRKGATSALQRDTSKDKRDIDVIRENHKFLWEDSDEPDSWEKRLAKKYYDKLFKEYCICDLSRFTENKVAMRWQTEVELVSGKGQFICGEKHCSNTEDLCSWEVNFAYLEGGDKKNSLVKLRLCPECSHKLNYKNKKKEAKRKSRKRSSSSIDSDVSNIKIAKTTKATNEKVDNYNEKAHDDEDVTEGENNIWKGSRRADEERPRDEDFEDYLEKLLL